ncbi:hypothetical protein BDV96DRAFT_602871 [Lophiotrema nucula]|uniref:Uncharacterized protein n=1 Tax=Lophiotrema nucula TaxID=690887 RepID=A0A6A5YYD7_9PLEO|nr:hypothetical protein BDV96DRAFT_602871 [Lophiotrema nucula]
MTSNPDASVTKVILVAQLVQLGDRIKKHVAADEFEVVRGLLEVQTGLVKAVQVLPKSEVHGDLRSPKGSSSTRSKRTRTTILPPAQEVSFPSKPRLSYADFRSASSESSALEEEELDLTASGVGDSAESIGSHKHPKRQSPPLSPSKTMSWLYPRPRSPGSGDDGDVSPWQSGEKHRQPYSAHNNSCRHQPVPQRSFSKWCEYHQKLDYCI